MLWPRGLGGAPGHAVRIALFRLSSDPRTWRIEACPSESPFPMKLRRLPAPWPRPCSRSLSRPSSAGSRRPRPTSTTSWTVNTLRLENGKYIRLVGIDTEGRRVRLQGRQASTGPAWRATGHLGIPGRPGQGPVRNGCSADVGASGRDTGTGAAQGWGWPRRGTTASTATSGIPPGSLPSPGRGHADHRCELYSPPRLGGPCLLGFPATLLLPL